MGEGCLQDFSLVEYGHRNHKRFSFFSSCWRSKVTVHCRALSSHFELSSFVLVQTFSSKASAYMPNQSASLSLGVKTFDTDGQRISTWLADGLDTHRPRGRKRKIRHVIVPETVSAFSSRFNAQPSSKRSECSLLLNETLQFGLTTLNRAIPADDSDCANCLQSCHSCR